MFRSRKMLPARQTAGKVLWGGAGIVSFLVVILLVPLILVNRFESLEATVLRPLQPKEELVSEEQPMLVPVYVTSRKETVEVPLEEYVRGVLAAEMPVDFELEALKAQAIAARTYLVRRLESGDTSNLPPEAGKAIVTDTVQHQAYATEEALRDRWGFFAYSRNIDKLTRAVNETKGLILTYSGDPIEATFFSTSNGFTENSELYWQEEIPYLRSVASPWDRLYAPNFERKLSLTYQELYNKLGLPVSSREPVMAVDEKAESGRVLKVTIAGKTFTGREVREKLGLASTDFQWTLSKETIEFTTEGSGHGVGMSQWGANGMAKEGKSAQDILQHYYTGVQIETFRPEPSNTTESL